MLLFLTTNMAAVMSHANQQYSIAVVPILKPYLTRLLFTCNNKDFFNGAKLHCANL